MNKQITLPIVVGLVIIFAAGSFYGGMQYQKQQSSNNGATGFQRGQFGTNGQMGQNGQRVGQAGQRNGAMRGGNFLSGEVLKMDDKSVTIKLNDGGSKTAYFTASTSVDKSTAGAVTDLKVGDKVTINGKASADGSVNAEMIQIRPQLRPILR